MGRAEGSRSIFVDSEGFRGLKSFSFGNFSVGKQVPELLKNASFTGLAGSRKELRFTLAYKWLGRFAQVETFERDAKVSGLGWCQCRPAFREISFWAFLLICSCKGCA